ncbi:glycoside hydrolase family 16 protein [Glutamicibacter sp.]|uniref:glycoside hydrolase family 16 protein n=1 Tax=Glutamicibacter sp. TaxID=1931995 RepID=UPI0028BD1C35|nr:glycoside hydrolase family 16 protein [Glutamicibacter sp.]
MSKRHTVIVGATLSLFMLFFFGSSVRAEEQHDLSANVSSFSAPAERQNSTSDSSTDEKNVKKADPDQLAVSEASEGKVLLDEKFDGSSLDTSVWNYCHWWNDKGCTIASNNELEWYLPEQVSVKSGTLRLSAKQAPTVGADKAVFDYASGMVTTGPQQYGQRPKLAFTYVRVDVKFKVPEGQGLWPAIWLLPASEESLPEIDIMEILGHDTDRLRMKLHPKDRSLDAVGQKYRLPKGFGFADTWHTVSLDWRPDTLVMYLNGVKVWELHSDLVPSEPMYLVMNLAVGGDYPGAPDDSTVFPATFQVERVRITGYE